MAKRKCFDCFDVRLTNVCNGLGAAIDKLQKFEKEKSKRHISKEKVILKLLRDHPAIAAITAAAKAGGATS